MVRLTPFHEGAPVRRINRVLDQVKRRVRPFQFDPRIQKCLEGEGLYLANKGGESELYLKLFGAWFVRADRVREFAGRGLRLGLPEVLGCRCVRFLRSGATEQYPCIRIRQRSNRKISLFAPDAVTKKTVWIDRAYFERAVAGTRSFSSGPFFVPEIEVVAELGAADYAEQSVLEHLVGDFWNPRKSRVPDETILMALGQHHARNRIGEITYEEYLESRMRDMSDSDAYQTKELAALLRDAMDEACRYRGRRISISRAHGDFAKKNLLVTGESQIYLLDLDASFESTVYYDFMYSLLHRGNGFDATAVRAAIERMNDDLGVTIEADDPWRWYVAIFALELNRWVRQAVLNTHDKAEDIMRYVDGLVGRAHRLLAR